MDQYLSMIAEFKGLAVVAILPGLAAACYIALVIYENAIGGAAGFGLWYFTEARPKKKNGRKRK